MRDIVKIDGTYRFPLHYILFYYADDKRLAIVLRDVSFDEKAHILPGARGCVRETFSHVELYDFRKGWGDEDKDKHHSDDQKCDLLDKMKFPSIMCEAYSDVIKNESSIGSHVFIKMPYMDTWRKIILMNEQMDKASIFIEDNYGTTMKELGFNIVLVADYMKATLDKLW